MLNTNLFKTITMFILLACITFPVIAEELTAPTTKTADDIKTTFTEEELATFKEERGKINKKMKAWWIQSFLGIDLDADGIATWKEVETRAIRWARKHPEERSAAEWTERFKVWDGNSDGFLTINEYKETFTVWLKGRLEEKKKKAEAAKTKANK